MRITQLYSNFGFFFREAATSKFNFIPYTDIYQPVLFIGCYNHHQLALSLNNRSLCVIYWGGSDAQALVKAGPDNFWADQFRQRNNIKHIAASRWIQHDLNSLGIENYFLPISLFDNSALSPCKLGDSVLMYNAESPLYNGGLYKAIKENMPELNFIETTPRDKKPREEVIETYKQCFTGLRLTEHDGLSETVVEMGLLGRRMIHNGDLPNCIKYVKTWPIDWFVEKIRELYQRRRIDSFYNDELAQAVNEYLYTSDDWLNTEFYGF